MNKYLLCGGAIALLSAVLFTNRPNVIAASTKDAIGWEYVFERRQELVRITPKPYLVESREASLCRNPTISDHNPHDRHWIHVYVSPSGTNGIVSGKGTYPEGTIILKQKFFDAEGSKTDFYTGMRKRESGYNPEVGDWEFFVLDSTAKAITARGKIESCMDCHRKYPNTDFVSRKYINNTP